MKRRMKIISRYCAIVVILVLCVPIILRLAMSHYIQKQIDGFLTEHTEITFKMEDMKFGLLPGVLLIEELTIQNQKDFSLKVKHLKIRLFLGSLLKGNIRFHQLECAGVILSLDKAFIKTSPRELEKDFWVEVLREIVGLKENHSVFCGDYFDKLQIRDIEFHFRDRLLDDEIKFALLGDYIGIQKIDIVDRDPLLRIEAYGRGLDRFCHHFEFSFFISKEGAQWGHFKVGLLDLVPLDGYLNAKKNVRLKHGFFSSSIFVQRSKEFFHAQIRSQIKGLAMDTLRPVVKINKFQAYLKENNGAVDLEYFVDIPSKESLVDNFDIVVKEFKKQLQQVIMPPNLYKDVSE